MFNEWPHIFKILKSSLCMGHLVRTSTNFATLKLTAGRTVIPIFEMFGHREIRTCVFLDGQAP